MHDKTLKSLLKTTTMQDIYASCQKIKMFQTRINAINKDILPSNGK